MKVWKFVTLILILAIFVNEIIVSVKPRRLRRWSHPSRIKGQAQQPISEQQLMLLYRSQNSHAILSHSHVGVNLQQLTAAFQVQQWPAPPHPSPGARLRGSLPYGQPRWHFPDMPFGNIGCDGLCRVLQVDRRHKGYPGTIPTISAVLVADGNSPSPLPGVVQRAAGLGVGTGESSYVHTGGDTRAVTVPALRRVSRAYQQTFTHKDW